MEDNQYDLITIAGMLSIYLIPWVIAIARDHHNKTAIFMLNVLLGWTALGWIIALIWSFTHVVKEQLPAIAPASVAQGTAIATHNEKKHHVSHRRAKPDYVVIIPVIFVLILVLITLAWYAYTQLHMR